MSTPLLQGIVPAVATPFRAGGQALDEAAAGRLVEFLINAGVHGLFALGSTGEAVLLEPAQRMRMAELVMTHTQGRLPVYIHVGALRPQEVIELSKHAARIGASGIAVLPPYYYSLDDAALERFFSQVAEAVTLPIYLYHIPMNAKNSIKVSLFSKLAERYPHILGMKDSGMDFGNFYDIIQAKKPHHSAMMGNDAQILAGLTLGGQGAVSAGATAVPEPYVRLWNAYHAGDMEGARKWQAVCAQVKAMFVKPYPISPIKRVLELRGICGPDVAPPLRPLSVAETELVDREFAAIQALLA
jgi:dihydrodipicolinate synthase/N-acetylneuraminate lyase